MSLESIQNYCFKENFAGNTHIECVPVQWIKNYPEFATDGHNFAQAIELHLGKAWLVFPCAPDSLDFRERERSGNHGTLDTPAISGFVPGDTPNIASVLNSAKANEWVVILYYKTGEAKVIGSPDYPARFSSSFNNRGSLNSGKGYDIDFNSEGDFKSFFLEETPGSGDVGCLPGVVVIKDSNGVDIDTVVAPSGQSVPYEVDGLPCAPDTKQWIIDFEGTETKSRVRVTASRIATFASGSGTNVGSMAISTDDITFTPIPYPFTPSVGVYYFERGTAIEAGEFILNQ